MDGLEYEYSFLQNIFQDITAVDPTTVIISYSNRTAADNAEFALINGVTIGGKLTDDIDVKVFNELSSR